MREAVKPVRCAVYTRKSTEDGLDQEFNSLDAQREACAAYILSQRHEGWTPVPEAYDDGGFSGGTMERPAFKRLLAEVAAGHIDVIVIYKVDRLTRSLSDFSKIVDVLDKAKASFVSITQAFNTTTSMGRLTLNMLLSFAQFEREVTGERIRDKIAASKRKGLWMGGPVPLGYAVQDRRLIVVHHEAELVRHVMRRYLALSSVRELVEELNAQGHRTKEQGRTSGPHRGGVAFARGTLFHLLRNRIYLGEIVHKGAAHPGEHPAIVDRQLWDDVQAAMQARTSGPSRPRRSAHPALLLGLLTDGLDRPMTHTHAKKGTKRYRYYVTRPDDLAAGSAWRVPAKDVEQIVREQLVSLLLDQSRIYDLVTNAGGEPAVFQQAVKLCEQAAETLRSGTAATQLPLVRQVVERIALRGEILALAVSASAMLDVCGVSRPADHHPGPIELLCPTAKVRQGHDLRLVIPSAAAPKPVPIDRDEKLIALLAEAQAARKLVLGSPGLSINRIATNAGRCRTRLGRLFTIAHLSPRIVTAIVEGRQPAALTARRLLEASLPADWAEQRKLLGFDEACS